ncbi:MAG: methyltransferase domain-containing protein [Chlorobi bacterium]|nr:methyltransferase domain-containing protein [Chlorobiota bacterium]
MKKEKIYPDSGVELSPFILKNYDKVMNIGSFGLYKGFIHKAIRQMEIQPDDAILDMGCGTGRNAELMLDYLSEKGSVTGIDLSEIMGVQFNERFKNDKRATFIQSRIDQEFDLNKKFDKVFISFVIHGFPHEIRQTVIRNARNHLKPDGAFIILDFGEFKLDEIPAFHRFIFKTIECKYAFDYVERDWKEILKTFGFSDFKEEHYFKKYVRLLKAKIPRPEGRGN